MNHSAAKAHDPSMEEILASIRRIIADDDGPRPQKPTPPKPVAVAPPPALPGPAAVNQDGIDAMLASFDGPSPAPEPEPEPEPEPDKAVLERTEVMALREPEPPVFRTMDPEPDLMFGEPPQPAMPASRDAPRPALPSALSEEPIVSAATSAAVDAAFGALGHTVLVQNARTLEDLVKEMLRPMLKAWLDENLPTMVERLVRAEIERVSRGRG